MADLITLARPYAKAAFGVAVAENALQEWADSLALLAAVSNHEAVAKALTNPTQTEQQQVSLVMEICGDKVGDRAGNLLRVLAENKRLALLPQILELFLQMKAGQEKTVDVEVLTAFPLSAEIEQKLTEALSKRLQRSVNVQSQIDKNLIGGIVVRAGDLVIDGSVRGRLNKLAEAMNS